MAVTPHPNASNKRLPTQGLAALAFVVVCFASGVNALALGFACQGGPADASRSRSAAANAFCRWVNPTYGKSVYHGSHEKWLQMFHGHLPPNSTFEPSLIDDLRGIPLFLVAPIVLVALAITTARRRRDRWYLSRGSILAFVLAIGPLVAFIIMGPG